MKPTMTMFVCVLAAGMSLAQNPSIIQNTRNQMNTVRDNAAAASNAALAQQESSPSRASQPHAPSATVTAVRPAGNTSQTRPAGPKRAAAVFTPTHNPTHNPASNPASNSMTAHKNNGHKALKAGAITGVPVAGEPSASETAEAEDPAGSEQRYNPKGKRDPFLSPVVNKAGGSNCSAGKKCLEIGTISLQGVVRSDTGFIAVVSNGMNKAYFLHENDPVFNGYVIKITGDSIVFQETLQDHLGKVFTREVVKKIIAPAV
ncbi:MAG: hypothetical protein WBS24_03140 [Terriglobales bacterium]